MSEAVDSLSNANNSVSQSRLGWKAIGAVLFGLVIGVAVAYFVSQKGPSQPTNTPLASVPASTHQLNSQSGTPDWAEMERVASLKPALNVQWGTLGTDEDVKNYIKNLRTSSLPDQYTPAMTFKGNGIEEWKAELNKYYGIFQPGEGRSEITHNIKTYPALYQAMIADKLFLAQQRVNNDKGGVDKSEATKVAPTRQTKGNGSLTPYDQSSKGELKKNN
jgi:hypothetical protein